jgi:hypothetical protein
MRLAYLTTDEVNQALAQEMAPRCGVSLCPLAPKDGPPDRGYDAVLCDWDSWPAERREELLAGLGGLRSGPVAVHSYSLDAAQADALRSRGVAVHRRLEKEVFQLLCGAAMSVRPNGAAVHTQEDTERAVR